MQPAPGASRTIVDPLPAASARKQRFHKPALARVISPCLDLALSSGIMVG